MAFTTFKQFIQRNPYVRQILQISAQNLPSKNYNILSETGLIVLLFPIVRFIIVQIGLPWANLQHRYSEAQRQQLEDWLDDYAEQHDLDPDNIETASTVLMQNLEKTHEIEAQAQWEQLLELLQTESISPSKSMDME
jgi:hypothetical protein